MRTNYDEAGFPKRFALSRQISAIARQRWAEELRLAAPSRTTRIFDIGAGTGRFWPALRDAFPGAIMVAVDSSMNMLRAPSRSEPVACAVGDAVNLPFVDASADFCFYSMILHYLSRPDTALREVERVLRRHGRVFIRQGTQDTVSSLRFLEFFPTALAIERARMPTAATIRALLRDTSLVLITEKRVRIPASGSADQYLQGVAARGFPSLQLVPDAEFAAGMNRLEARLRNDPQFIQEETTAVFVAEARHG
jgi:ubiquinone/menaquinone biosynthesis C-methylase UbiE